MVVFLDGFFFAGAGASATVEPAEASFTTFRTAFERKCDFDCIEHGLTDQGALSETFRCLRCDHYGYGAFRGGREDKW